ncbi:MAG: hypothetical protein M0C28_28810 [Candidatus Moduliflexus flocculans]|nr:hypothetical protein [Candidatus Moduliflexus flocculans]
MKDEIVHRFPGAGHRRLPHRLAGDRAREHRRRCSSATATRWMCSSPGVTPSPLPTSPC